MTPDRAEPATLRVAATEEPHAESLETLVAALGTDPACGLHPTEAAARLERDGENALRAERPVPMWRRFLAQFNDPLIYLLLVAIVISLVAWMAEGGSGVPVDALVIAAIVLLNAVIGVVQEGKAAQAVAALQTLTAPHSTVVRGGSAVRIPSREVVAGDLLVLEEGDHVAADGRLVHATNLLVGEAALTGESVPVEKAVGSSPVATPIAERTGMVHAGTAVAQGVGRALVTGTGMRTEMGAIADLLHGASPDATPLQREIGFVGRVLTVAVIVIAIVVMVTVYVLTPDHSVGSLVTILLLGVSLAVAAVPEGLPAILSLVLALGVQRMAGHRAIVTQLSSVETLGSASIVCTDKTGTLTRNEMTIERVVVPRSPERGEATASFSLAELASAAESGEGPAAQALEVLALGTIANNAQVSFDGPRAEIVGDPTEVAFQLAEHALAEGEAARTAFTRAHEAVRMREVPFSSERKRMSVVIEGDAARGAPAVVSKGAPDVLLERCSSIRTPEGDLPLTTELREHVLAQVRDLTHQAYRTLAVAERVVDDLAVLEGHDDGLERDATWIGVVGIVDPPRSEAAAAIAECHEAGVRVVMITGDHPATAARIAAALGIEADASRRDAASRAWPAALTGNDLDALSPAEFDEAIGHVNVYARVAPKHKLAIVDRLQAQGSVVAMTGDGVNDAPALKQADIGVAMGITGTQVTREAANMVLADDNFATIVRAVREGRGIFANIRTFLRYLLSSNMGEVLTVFLGVALAGVLGLVGPDGVVVLPLLATQILWINLLTDSAPAIALGVDPAPGDVMRRPPRRLRDRVIDGEMWLSVVLIGLVMALAALLAIDVALPGGLVPGGESLDVGRTMAFTVLVFAQLFNTVNCRSDVRSAFSGLFRNRWLGAAVALSVVLQVLVVHVPFLNTAFGTAPLSLTQWATCLGLASCVLWFDEAKKLVVRAVRARRG